jgi:hypothetical protein
MANTTNYNWETPDDTDLVKDGAAAIRTLGSSVDTTTKALNPSTTLGDIEYRSATANTNTRLAIGTTGQVLTVAGGVPTWATSDDANAIQNAIVDAKGDIIAATAADTPARLAVGANGTVLTADSAEATGLKWATPTSGSNEALGYKWDMWNPTNNTGTETNAPSTGTSSGNTTNISVANSSGTLTATLGAGTYLITTNTNAIISAGYTYAAVLSYIGGTATSYLALKASPNNYIAQWGEGDQSGDFTLSSSFIVAATASQTITILPKGRTSGAGATNQYQYYATASIVRM